MPLGVCLEGPQGFEFFENGLEILTSKITENRKILIWGSKSSSRADILCRWRFSNLPGSILKGFGPKNQIFCRIFGFIVIFSIFPISIFFQGFPYSPGLGSAAQGAAPLFNHPKILVYHPKPWDDKTSAPTPAPSWEDHLYNGHGSYRL